MKRARVPSITKPLSLVMATIVVPVVSQFSNLILLEISSHSSIQRYFYVQLETYGSLVYYSLPDIIAISRHPSSVRLCFMGTGRL